MYSYCVNIMRPWNRSCHNHSFPCCQGQTVECQQWQMVVRGEKTLIHLSPIFHVSKLKWCHSDNVVKVWYTSR
jgi:hypothetical protein